MLHCWKSAPRPKSNRISQILKKFACGEQFSILTSELNGFQAFTVATLLEKCSKSDRISQILKKIACGEQFRVHHTSRASGLSTFQFLWTSARSSGKWVNCDKRADCDKKIGTKLAKAKRASKSCQQGGLKNGVRPLTEHHKNYKNSLITIKIR